MRRLVLGILACLSVVAVVAPGCGTEAVGVETCKEVEEARCRRAESCGISLERPVHRDGKSTEACVRYYNDACLHGLASNNDPGAVQSRACADAIANGSCDVVKKPELDPACSFLIPAGSPAVDAGADAAASTTVTDSGSTVSFPFDATVVFDIASARQ